MSAVLARRTAEGSGRRWLQPSIAAALLLAAAAVLAMYAELVRSAADKAAMTHYSEATARPVAVAPVVRTPDDLRLSPVSVHLGSRLSAHGRNRGGGSL